MCWTAGIEAFCPMCTATKLHLAIEITHHLKRSIINVQGSFGSENETCTAAPLLPVNHVDMCCVGLALKAKIPVKRARITQDSGLLFGV
jgi:hypothetical protein